MDNEDGKNVCAQAVNLMEWLSGDTTFAVPAYQRNYRWDVKDCEALLVGIRNATEKREPYFIGSILSTGTESKRMLVDGQQRLITLTLLLTALYHSANSLDKESIKKILYDPTNPDTPRVRPFDRWEDVLKGIIFCDSVAESEQFGKNFDYFKKEAKENPSQIWDGLQKLTCVDILITLKNMAQQIFESLNSTGVRLRDAELINNWILMPYDNDKFQGEIQKTFWIPVEKNATKDGGNTGDQMDDFFHHYLSLKIGDKVEEKNIFTTFKEFFTGKLADEVSLQKSCQEWLDLSTCYNHLLNPKNAKDDEDIQESLVTLNIFGESSYPFLMAVLNDYNQKIIDRELLLKILHLIETYYFRHAVCGTKSEEMSKFMAKLFNGLDKSNSQRYLETLSQKLFQNIPRDGSIREYLSTGVKKHGTEILIKLDKKKLKDELKGVDKATLEHIFPCEPVVDWMGEKAIITPDEEIQNMRDKLNSIGNWAPLESGLNSGANNRSFPDKKDWYKDSRFDMIKNLVDVPIWNTEAIKERTEKLTVLFLEKWSEPIVPNHNNDSDFVQILNVPYIGTGKDMCYKELKYSQAEFRGKPIQPCNIKELYLMIIKELWAEDRANVLRANAKVSNNWQPIVRGQKGKSLDADYSLSGLWYNYSLKSLQDLLVEMGLADQLFVKYA